AARQPAPATGPSYGPVLHPQTTRSEPGAQPEQTPQAQEEKAGGMPQQQPHKEADPSARPAPQQQAPARTDGKEPKKQANATPRRPVQSSIARMPEGQPNPAPNTVVTPPPPAVGPPAAPQPSSARLNSCLGNTCTDSGGTTYQTNVGNAGVSSEGRLCTRNGANVQCF
ncbi:MAG TPA: hypothetical protein DDZ22_18170, partial [Massilia sp.]|nr:hypothetical protein [Massilia sp.]